MLFIIDSKDPCAVSKHNFIQYNKSIEIIYIFPAKKFYFFQEILKTSYIQTNILVNHEGTIATFVPFCSFIRHQVFWLQHLRQQIGNLSGIFYLLIRNIIWILKHNSCQFTFHWQKCNYYIKIYKLLNRQSFSYIY